MAMEITHVDQLPGYDGWPDPDLLRPFDAAEIIEIARSLAPQVQALLSEPSRTSSIVDELFYTTGFWRDAIALSWSLRTLHTAKCARGPNIQ